MPPLISVVIPCHGQAHFLADAVESVRTQDYTPYEIIVVDDGSPDNVAEIAAGFPVSLLRSAECHGVGHARNLGLQSSSGEYVVCLDADDRLLPHALSAGADALAHHSECPLTWGGRSLIDASGALLPVEPQRTQGSASYESLLRGNLIGPPAGVMFRRSALEAAGGFAEDLQGAEDYEAYLRLARKSVAYGHGRLIAEYRIHTANMSANHAYMLTAVLAVLDRQQQYVGRDRRLRRALAAGRRWARESYDLTQRLVRLGEYRRARRWGSTLLCTAQLLWRYPRKFLPILTRRVVQSVLPRS